MEKKEFRTYLKTLRNKAGLTIKDVEEKTGISNSYISMMETGKRDIPSPDILKKLTMVYGVTYKELMSAAGYIGVEFEELSTPNSTIGERLKILLKENNITMKEFGTMFQLDESTVSLYLSGERNPDDNTKIKICDKFNVSLDWLLGRTEHKHVVIKQIAPGIEIGQNMYSDKVYTPEDIDNVLKIIQNQLAKNKKEE